MKTFSIQNGIDGLNFQRLAYRDFLAARFLLLNNYLIQGATLSSSAVEKYLKSILSIVGSKKAVHLDRIEKLESLFRTHGITILTEIDPVYLELLGKAYSLRYYDQITSKELLSVHKWQALAELDHFVALIDGRISMTKPDGTSRQSEYAADKAANARHLIEENHVISGVEKKIFMEREGPCAIICVSKNSNELLSHLLGIRPVSYTGSALKVTGFEPRGLQVEVKWNQPVTISEEHRQQAGHIRD